MSGWNLPECPKPQLNTHLSITWYLMKDGEGSQASKIISLSKDFTLLPGPLFTERFAAGDVRLDKLGVTTFRLSMGRLQPSDQGQLFCEATEWISRILMKPGLPSRKSRQIKQPSRVQRQVIIFSGTSLVC